MGLHIGQARQTDNQLLTMKSLLCFLQISSLCSLLAAQCDDTLPGGDVCGTNDYMWVADPDCCWKYYECDAGCVTHQECEKDFKFDVDMEWCTYPTDVDCRARPCDDLTHCPGPLTTTTGAPDCTPEEQWHDCADSGAGYFPDEYNCRAYWHCANANKEPEHIICPDDNQGNPEMFDLEYNGCNFDYLTKCGNRPVGDECNENCDSNAVDCGHDLDCSNKQDGYYADPFSCRKYWHCQHGVGEHVLCKDNLMYDPGHVWCDFPENVNCGNRPPCNECNEGCP